MNDEHIGVEAHGVLWMATRYALGRATYAVGEVCDAIAQHAHRLPDGHRERMAHEIETAIGSDAAGMDCDVTCWRQAVRVLRGKGGTS